MNSSAAINLEEARSALRAAYKMRDAIKAFRNPFHDMAEIRASLGPDDDLRKYERPLYAKRWESVMDAGRELRLIELEGEVLWGRPFVTRLQALTACVRDLSFAVGDYLRYKDAPLGGQGMLEAAEAIVMGKLGRDAPDDFEKRVLGSIESLEQFLRPRLELKLK